jgi:hypothetical protein
MPRFFFHFISHDHLSRDEVGTVFSSLEAAYLDTWNAALEMAMESLRAQDDPTNDGFEITDEDGRMLMHVPFSEVLRPRQKVPLQANRPTTSRAIEACQQQRLRGQTLQSELRTEFEKVVSTCQSIQAKLAILKAGHRPE